MAAGVIAAQSVAWLVAQPLPSRPAPGINIAVPFEMHWCAAHCTTLRLDRGAPFDKPHYGSVAQGSLWVVERFTPDLIVIQRTDYRPFPGRATLRGRVSPDGNSIAGGTMEWTFHPCCGLSRGTFQAAWGTAIDSVPGSDEERERRARMPQPVQPHESVPPQTVPPNTPRDLPVPAGQASDSPLYHTLSAQDPPAVRHLSALNAWIKGQAYAADGKFPDALFWYERSAAKGNGDAALEIGLLYDRGHGVQKDQAQAARWYRLAVEKGNTIAMRRLGILYYAGWGVPRNQNQTRELGQRAAEAGESDAAFGLAQLDSARAGYWINRARNLLGEAAPVCEAARSTMAILITDMYHSPGFMAANGIANLDELLDGGEHSPHVNPDRSISRVAVSKVHGSNETECDAVYQPEGNTWPFRINRIATASGLLATPFTRVFTADGKTFLVTRASFPQQLLLMTLRRQLMGQIGGFVTGLHDLGP